MNRPTCLLLLLLQSCAFLALCGVSRGQESRDTAKPLSARDPLPEFPVNGLLDEGNIFKAEEEVLLTADLEDFRHRVGVPLYVLTSNYIFGATVEHYGERLVNEGLKGRAGVVLLYERGSGQLHYNATPGALGRNEDMKLLFLAGSKAAAYLPDDATAAQRLRAAVQALTTASEQWKKHGTLPELAVEPAPPPSVPDKTAPPPPPPDFLTDDADAFDAATEAALKAELVKFHAQHDMDVYLVTHTYLQSSTAQDRATTLAAAWLRDRYGAVLVLNRGTAVQRNKESPDIGDKARLMPPEPNEVEQGLGIALSASNEQIMPGAQLLQAETAAHAKAEEVRRSEGGSLPQGMQAAARVLMQVLATRGGQNLAVQSQTTSPGQWSVMQGVAASLLAGAALLFAFHRFQERLETRTSAQFHFPDVTVGRRLGATQGGGTVAGISWAEKR